MVITLLTLVESLPHKFSPFFLTPSFTFAELKIDVSRLYFYTELGHRNDRMCQRLLCMFSEGTKQ